MGVKAARDPKPDLVKIDVDPLGPWRQAADTMAKNLSGELPARKKGRYLDGRPGGTTCMSSGWTAVGDNFVTTRGADVYARGRLLAIR
jgi:hypothetical protein